MGRFALQQQRQQQLQQQQQQQMQQLQQQKCGVSVLRMVCERQRGWLCACLSTGIVIIFSIQTQHQVYLLLLLLPLLLVLLLLTLLPFWDGREVVLLLKGCRSF